VAEVDEKEAPQKESAHKTGVTQTAGNAEALQRAEVLRDRAREQQWKGAVSGAKRDSDKLVLTAPFGLGGSAELAALRLHDSITSGLGLASLLPPLPTPPGYAPSSAVIRDSTRHRTSPYAAAAAAAAAAVAPQMHADFSGWRCVHDGQTDRLMVSAHGLPRGAAWRVVVHDERWAHPHMTKQETGLTCALTVPPHRAGAPSRTGVRICLEGNGGAFPERWTDWHELLPLGRTVLPLPPSALAAWQPMADVWQAPPPWHVAPPSAFDPRSGNQAAWQQPPPPQQQQQQQQPQLASSVPTGWKAPAHAPPQAGGGDLAKTAPLAEAEFTGRVLELEGVVTQQNHTLHEIRNLMSRMRERTGESRGAQAGLAPDS
jgi:hypothetical protein